MIQAVLIIGGLGFVIGAGLAAASKLFHVYVDPKVEAIEGVLPGANCGGCGLPGCSANAEAVVAGKASPTSCVAGGSELADAIAAILGVSVEAKEPDIALPGCAYNVEQADTKYVYDGISDCIAAALFSGGMKVCEVGCLGLGSCVKACPFDAISIGENGLPHVDKDKCTGCGTCERVCPKNIITLTSVTRRMILEYTSEHCTTPCQRACPVGIDIKEYISQITSGNYHKAVQVIKERNPFPTVIGRICPRPCETECRRKYIDEPVAINFLKRYVADYEKEAGGRILPFKAPATNKKIAVIGGGVSGLSAAYFLARLGHLPTVFEKSSELGGLLKNAIAKERLPQEILDWDIKGIIEIGAEVELNKSLGSDFTIETLLEEGFEAVAGATGGWDGRLAEKEMDSNIIIQLPSTHLLIDIMKNGYRDICASSEIVIYGGGEAAIEAAKECKNNGAGVTIIFENSPSLDISDTAGIKILYGKKIERIIGAGDKLTEIEYEDLKTGLKTVIQCDNLFIAAGRHPEFIFKKCDSETIVSVTSYEKTDRIRWEGIKVYSKEETLSDYSAAVKAIDAGRRSAAAAHNLIYGLAAPTLPKNSILNENNIQDTDNINNVIPLKRNIMPLSTSSEIDRGCEAEKGFDSKAFQDEAKRCLQCGLICYRKDEA